MRRLRRSAIRFAQDDGGRQLILWTGAPERQLSASPEMLKPCFS
jgi:hypothetical protein